MIYRFVKHDVNEGIFKHNKRYILILLVVVVVCAVIDSSNAIFYDIYGVKWSVYEYVMRAFDGRMPFVLDAGFTQKFTIPMEWVLIYITLSYCIGDYANHDLQGFGMMFMLKSKKRIYWWVSKCIWCIGVNIVFFLLFWLGVIGYTWVRYGEVIFIRHNELQNIIYGDEITKYSNSKLMIMVVCMPLIVGIVQSAFQMVISLLVDGITATIIIASILVSSCYYGHKLLPHGYAMFLRCIGSGNDVLFGVKYLVLLAMAFMVMGFMVIRRKNILER